jgi:hypothetical protein
MLWERKEKTGIPITTLVNLAVREFLGEVKHEV